MSATDVVMLNLDPTVSTAAQTHSTDDAPFTHDPVPF
jgi:hypothetical protein